MKNNIFKSIIVVFVFLMILSGCRKQNASTSVTENETERESIVNTDVAEETLSNEDDTVYYGQSEISKDDIVFVPHVTVEIPEENVSETPDE